MSGSCGSPAWSAPFPVEADRTLQVQPFPSPLLVHATVPCSSAGYGDAVQMWLRPAAITHNSCVLVSVGSHGWWVGG